MEPQWRFCTSADGTRIAYATYGSGPPLLYANTPVLSIDAQFRVPEARSYFDALAARAGLVLFDRRGTGASQRDVDDLSPEAEAGDIAAVADAAGLRDFTLFADIAMNPCLTYALSDQQRSRNLVLWSPLVAARPNPELADMARVARRDWSYFRRLWASRLFPDGPVSLQRAMGKAYKDTNTPEMAARRMDFVLEGPDFEELLPRVTVPVLLIDREVFPHAVVMRIAALLPRGQVAFVPGYPPTPYPDHEAIVDAVFEFMGLDEPVPLASGTSILLFTDIADSAALTERMGDAGFRAASRTFEDGVRAAVREQGGTAVDGKVLGDGVMGVFTSAANAIAAARACVGVAEAAQLQLHVGLHAGDVIGEGTNVYGGAVNIASRICGLCAPGEILVSQTVRDLARTSAGVTFDDRGEHELKGIADPVRVFAVSGLGEPPARTNSQSTDLLARLAGEEVRIRVQREDLVREGTWAIVEYSTELASGLCPEELGSKSPWHGSIKWDELQAFCARLRVLGLVDVQIREHRFRNGDTELWETYYLNDEGSKVVRAITARQRE